MVRTRRETDFEDKLKKKTQTSGCAQGTVFGDLMEEFDQVRLNPDARVRTSWLYQLTKKINTEPSLYLKAGAIHGCVLAHALLQRLHERFVRHRLNRVRAYLRLQLRVVARLDRRQDGRRAARDELRVCKRRERLRVARQCSRDREQRVVGQQPAARPIAALRRGLAPAHEGQRRALRGETEAMRAFEP